MGHFASFLLISAEFVFGGSSMGFAGFVVFFQREISFFRSVIDIIKKFGNTVTVQIENPKFV